MVNRGVRFDATQSDVSEQSAMSEERMFSILIIGTLVTTNIAMCESTGSKSGQIV